MNDNKNDNENYFLRKQDLRKYFGLLWEWLNKPSVSPLMLIFMIVIIIVNIVINSVLFVQLALIGMLITIVSYLPIALVKAKTKSGLLTLVGKILDILIEDHESDEEKVKQMEYAVMALMQEINKYYEKKVKQFTEYLKKKKGG